MKIKNMRKTFPSSALPIPTLFIPCSTSPCSVHRSFAVAVLYNTHALAASLIIVAEHDSRHELHFPAALYIRTILRIYLNCPSKDGCKQIARQNFMEPTYAVSN